MDESDKIPYLLLFILALVVNFSGINVGFFTDDQGLYASIAKNLVAHHNFFRFGLSSLVLNCLELAPGLTGYQHFYFSSQAFFIPIYLPVNFMVGKLLPWLF